MKKQLSTHVGLLLLFALASIGCQSPEKNGGKATSRAGATSVQINGAGATFPFPIYSKWFSDYNKLHPDVQINYQSIGSGGGIRQLTNRTVFFGATDGPMTDEQLKAAAGPVLHIPTVLGAVVPIYNLEGVSSELRFTGPVLAKIILGKITKWNDPAIAAINPGVTLPDKEITVVHRSDGSGTTYIFTDYLSRVSPDFMKTVGRNTSVQWPAGVGAKGNEGVAGMVKQTLGSIGYVELIYASQNKISFASVQNREGIYIKASPESVTAAASGASSSMPDDFRVSITDAGGSAAYPISSYTWLLLYEVPEDKARARAMVDFTRWALTDGEKAAAALGYAPLPEAVAEKAIQSLGKIHL